ncbi:WD40-like Beta Propeller Repeat [Nonlabens sp. Hel1_33_55]|uniref:OmpA family protein n=1 Tax=Nonlabens sp. Hel1_33_55 TaxID=1336802 RepID=UPI000875CE78|nr:OmpA family protein [Nonlabens sp. Hel1_33_55]SCY07223.1 WD40-like Beta Propeller Repeat [Nonlabens sp. Hel1_33_55]
MKRIFTILIVFAITSSYGQNIKKANSLFEKNSLVKAAEAYNEIIEKDKSLPKEVFSNAALANYEVGNYRSSASIYSQMKAQNYSLSDSEIFNYVRSLRGVREYEKADLVYREFLQNSGAVSKLAAYEREKRAFDSVFNLEDDNKVLLKNLEINTNYAEFSPVNHQGNLIFSSSRPGAAKALYERTEQPYLSLYTVSVNNMYDSESVRLLSDNLNSDLHDATIAFSPESDVIYFSSNESSKNLEKNQESNFDLYKARWVNNEVINREKLHFNNSTSSAGHPFVNADGTMLFFASDMPDGYGGADIYYCKIYEDGMISDPINAGELINSYGDDFTPFMTKDGDFYFASDGHVGYGGLDIFKADFDSENKSFSQLVNLGASYNTSYDDFSFTLNNTKGYLASNRPGGKGDDDIYEFEIQKEECSQMIQGTVYDLQSKAVLPRTMIFVTDENGTSVASTFTDDMGKYTLSTACTPPYKVTASIMEYFVKSKTLEISDGKPIENVDFFLEQPKKMIVTNKDGEKQLKLDPIYFEYDKATIAKESKPVLDKVVEFLNFYPDIQIRIESHTDSRGSDLYNLKLSKERATSTLNYLTSRGIDKRQIISADGYGEYRPLKPCDESSVCSDSDYDMNRRSAFIVINN